MCVTGVADGPPTYVWPAIGDSGTGMHMAIGILAAIEQRHTTGRGQHVEVAMQDAVVNIIRVSLREHQRHGVPERTGNQLGKTVPGTTYRCAPGGPNDYVYIFAQPQMWAAVCKALGRPELEANPLFKTGADRWQNRAALEAIITEWTMQRTKHEVMKADGRRRRAVRRLPGYRRGAGRSAPEGARHDRRRSSIHRAAPSRPSAAR